MQSQDLKLIIVRMYQHANLTAYDEEYDNDNDL